MFEQFEGTSPVQDRHRFDVAALASYLQRSIDGFAGPLQVEQFKGGQSNPTFLLRTPARNYVLRRKPPGKLLPSAHAIEREYRVMAALRDSAVPVPRMFCLCEDADVIGSAFYVMEQMQGRILWEPGLSGFGADERARLFDDMNRVIAALHQVDVCLLYTSDAADE